MGFKTINNFEDIYVTGDLHLSNNVNRTISARGFNSGEEHTKFIRNLINSQIKNKSAVLYILGDLGFRNEDKNLISFIKSLTPLVKVAIGNHDSVKQLNNLWKMGVFQDCKHDYSVRYNNNLFYLSHFPLLEWDGFYDNSFHCHAHTHGNLNPYLRAYDVGLDNNDMKILNLQDIVDLRKSFNNIDENRNRIKLF